MNLLVGATGFIGGHLVEYLFQQGEISKATFRKGSHLKILDSNGVYFFFYLFGDHIDLHEAMEGVDAVYNLASPMPGSDTGFVPPNTEGLLNLLEVAVESKVGVFVHLSTLDVHGFRSRHASPEDPFNPSGEYQKAKAESERILQEFSKRSALPRVVIIRSARAVGSRDETLVVPLLRMIEARRVVLPEGGPLSFSHPKDVAQAMYKAATGQSTSGSVFLVKSYDATPRELGTGLASAIGKEVEVRRQGLLSSSALPKYTAEQLRASIRIDEQPNWKELGYAPAHTLEGTCEEVARWYRQEPWIVGSA